jgi:hypothetical protein
MEFLFILIVLAIVALIVVGVVSLVVGSSGNIEGTAPALADALMNDFKDYFGPEGWKESHRGSDMLILEKGPDGCMALFLLVVFLPLGLVYLLTDWGKARLALMVRPVSTGETEFRIEWRGSALRNQVQAFLGPELRS